MESTEKMTMGNMSITVLQGWIRSISLSILAVIRQAVPKLYIYIVTNHIYSSTTTCTPRLSPRTREKSSLSPTTFEKSSRSDPSRSILALLLAYLCLRKYKDTTRLYRSRWPALRRRKRQTGAQCYTKRPRPQMGGHMPCVG